MYGKVVEDNGAERFDWKHSYSKIYPQQEKYTPEGVFMSFEHYNVEVRDRVKCISGSEGEANLLINFKIWHSFIYYF